MSSATGGHALSSLLLLAVLAALYLARDLIRPLVLAFILSLVFAPVVRRLKRACIPQSLSAAVVVVVLLGAFFGSAYHLAEPARLLRGADVAPCARTHAVG